MFETSKDILYLVISFCVLWVTVFLCWTFYYVMRILRNANTIVEEFRVRLQALTEAINYIRGKVEHISGLMTLASSGVGGLIKKVVARKAESWMDGGTGRLNSAAKDAVHRAVTATAKKMKKVAAKVKR
ncbi:MAG: hypothetical protein HY983_01875 [Candidatus Magasanikbacteria bacterium]|nr:hypothetical protein [Candidatus Magasanikbacteria bacterium]